MGQMATLQANVEDVKRAVAAASGPAQQAQQKQQEQQEQLPVAPEPSQRSPATSLWVVPPEQLQAGPPGARPHRSCSGSGSKQTEGRSAGRRRSSGSSGGERAEGRSSRSSDSEQAVDRSSSGRRRSSTSEADAAAPAPQRVEAASRRSSQEGPAPPAAVPSLALPLRAGGAPSARPSPRDSLPLASPRRRLSERDSLLLASPRRGLGEEGEEKSLRELFGSRGPSRRPSSTEPSELLVRGEGGRGWRSSAVT